MTVTAIAKSILKVIQKMFIPHPLLAKYPYMIPVRIIAPRYMILVDPTRMNCHLFVSDCSHLLMQLSDQVCAKSTRRMSPKRIKMPAPIKAV
jgi:hypothetical protein